MSVNPRDSVLPVDANQIEIVQYRRRHSLGFEESKLEPIKEYEQFEEIRLSNNSDNIEDKKPACLSKDIEQIVSKNVHFGGVGVAPDGGYGWVIVFCSFMLNFIVDGITLTEGLLTVPITKASNNKISVTEFSWVNGSLTGVTLLAGPLSALMVNKFGFRTTIIVGSIIASSGILLSWAASPTTPNIYYFILFYGIVAGIGFGLVFSPSVVIVTHYFESKRALATGITVCGTGMGTLAMAPLGAILIENFDWSGTIPIQAGIVLLCIIFAVFQLQPPTVPPLKKIFNRTKTSQRRPSLVISASTKIMNGLREFVPFFISPTYMILAISGGITMLGFFSPFAFISDRAEPIIHDKVKQSFCLGTMGITNVIARIVFGFLGDRKWTNNLMMSNIALTIGGLATSFSYLIQSYTILLLYCALFGLCIGCFTTLRSILILEFVGLEKMNDGFGLSLMFMGITSFFSSPIAGMLIDGSGGSYNLAFQMAGLFLLVSAVLCYPLRYIDRWEKSWKTKK